MKKILVIVLLNTLAMPLWASGGGGGGGGTISNNSGFRSSSYVAPKRIVDYDFERGKAIYKRKISRYRKATFCFKQDGGTVKLNKKRIKQYKGLSYQQLADVVVDCKQLEQSLTKVLGQKDALCLLYYLDKRYNMSLTEKEAFQKRRRF